MKQIIALILALLLAAPAFGELSKDATEKRVVFEIVYNSITLEEASDIEREIRSDHKDACKLVVSLY